MGDTLVKMEMVSRVYQTDAALVEALKHVTCEIRKGDKIALVGASGSGKSTWLNLAAGLDRPTTGRISWPGFDDSISLRPGQIGIVFQTHSLLPGLSVAENVMLPLLLMEIPNEKAYKLSMEILSRFELDSLADKLPDELSGGQVQRVAVARAFTLRPRLILADEPTGQLDHTTSARLLDEMLAFAEETRAAVVIATHDTAAAGRMRNIWSLNHGIMAVGE